MILLLGFSREVTAQDIHFSHIHASPTVLNPAMTGLFDGDYRLIMNYKNQWRNTTANYNTLHAGFDAKVTNLGGTGFLGMGLNVIADRAGDLNYTNTSAMLTLSTARALNREGDHFITVAIQAGMLHNYLDYSRLHVFDQEPLVQAGAPGTANAWDASAGIGWFKRVVRDGMIYLGASVFHLGQPDMAMLGQTAEYNEQLARRWVFHGGGDIKIVDRYYLMPSFMIMEQSPHREINTGTFLRYDWQEYKRGKGSSVFFGAWFRYFVRTDISSSYDALILAARLDKNSISYSFSYDVNMSSLATATRGVGGPEISVIFRGSWYHKPQYRVDCPKNF
jgi:type IX secretion system PorP/SprF family membrane protein